MKTDREPATRAGARGGALLSRGRAGRGPSAQDAQGHRQTAPVAHPRAVVGAADRCVGALVPGAGRRKGLVSELPQPPRQVRSARRARASWAGAGRPRVRRARGARRQRLRVSPTHTHPGEEHPAAAGCLPLHDPSPLAPPGLRSGPSGFEITNCLAHEQKLSRASVG